MAEKKTYKRKRPGASPGSLVLVGKKRLQEVAIESFDYSPDFFEEKTKLTPDECLKYRDTDNISWVNIDGLHDTEVIRKIGTHYIIHPLTLEDILDTIHRPKLDDMDHYIYVSLKMLSIEPGTNKIIQELISIVFGFNWVLSFQEFPGDVFVPVRERLRAGKGRMRKMGADYLAYTLMDAIIDNYFLVVESLGERIEKLDNEVISHANKNSLRLIHDLKNELIMVRKVVWPLRDIVNSLYRTESELIQDDTTVFIRDMYDHVIQIIETIEIYRDQVNGLFDIYLSSISNRTNDIMRVLTVMTSIFIPLTFVVGIYGMNFHSMPELSWEYGYPFTWVIMITIAVSMFFFFKRRGWL